MSILASYILLAIGLIWLIAASIMDVKKREVANWISFSLIIIALGIRAISSIITKDSYFFLYGLLGLAIFFIIANILYYGKIFAGGDAKLLMALGAVFPTHPLTAQFSSNILGLEIPFMLTFLINILFIGAIYGLIYSITLTLLNSQRFKKEIKISAKKTRKFRFILLAMAFIFLILSIISGEVVLFILTIIIFIFPYLFVFVKAVESSCMTRLIDVKKLTEGDWLVDPIKIKGKIIKPKWEGLDMKEINLIQKSKIKKILVKQGLPFVPIFFLALIASLYSNLLMWLVSLLT